MPAMRYTYTIPAADTLRFQIDYSRELQKKIFPFWFIEPFRFLYAAAVFLVARLVTHSTDAALFLGCAMVFLQLAWQILIGRIRQKRTARYFASVPPSEDWSVEISGDKLINQNEISSFSFPLVELSTITKKNGFLYIDFPKRGRCRVPLTVFQTLEDKSRFIALLEQYKSPAHSPVPNS